MSLSIIKRCHREIGWVCTRPHYCQLIRENNKVKRKEWCQKLIDNRENFENIIFTDECTVQLGGCYAKILCISYSLKMLAICFSDFLCPLCCGSCTSNNFLFVGNGSYLPAWVDKFQ